MKRIHRYVLGTLSLSFLVLPLRAQETRPAGMLEARIDSIFVQYDSRESPGCAVTLVREGRQVFAKGYGMASLEHDAVPNKPYMDSLHVDEGPGMFSCTPQLRSTAPRK